MPAVSPPLFLSALIGTDHQLGRRSRYGHRRMACIMPTTVTSAKVSTALEPLGISHILASALPAELGTESSPGRYTVQCVLSRHVEPAELKMLLSEEIAARLSGDGFPVPTLTVSDRRLLVHDTNLEELDSGLARSIASALRHVTATVVAAMERRAETLAELQTRENARAEGVRATAKAIDFS